MRKLLVGLAALMAITASGCTLYFGESNGGDVSVTTYCEPGPNGTVCYTCYQYPDGWQECFPDSYGCNDDNDCATGCYCDEGTGECVEAGWCNTTADCGGGLTCDCSGSCAEPGQGERNCSSCQVDGCPPGFVCAANGQCVPDPNMPGCSSDAECAAACYCEQGYCEESSICTNDSQCPSGQTCDEARNTCVPCGHAGNSCEPPPPPPPRPRPRPRRPATPSARRPATPAATAAASTAAPTARCPTAAPASAASRAASARATASSTARPCELIIPRLPGASRQE